MASENEVMPEDDARPHPTLALSAKVQGGFVVPLAAMCVESD